MTHNVFPLESTPSRSPLKGGEYGEWVRGTGLFIPAGMGGEWVGMGRFVRELREWVRECRSPFVPSFGGNGWGIGRIYFMY